MKPNRGTNVLVTAEYPQFADPAILAQIVRELAKDSLRTRISFTEIARAGRIGHFCSRLLPDIDLGIGSGLIRSLQAILAHVAPELTKRRIARTHFSKTVTVRERIAGYWSQLRRWLSHCSERRPSSED